MTKLTRRRIDEQRDYYALLAEARRLSIPTSLDDPRSPRTIAALRKAVERAS